MRFIVERWYLGPILALVSLYVCALLGYGVGQLRSEEIEHRTLSEIYRLAKEQRYDEILSRELAPTEAVNYFKQQDRLFGPIQSWNDNSGPWSEGSTSVMVKRKGVEGTDIAVAENPYTFSCSLYGRHNAGAGPVTTPEEALNAARPILYSTDSDLPFKSSKVERVGDDWLVTVYLKPGILVDPVTGKTRVSTSISDRVMVVISAETGDMTEHIRDGKVEGSDFYERPEVD